MGVSDLVGSQSSGEIRPRANDCSFTRFAMIEVWTRP